MSGDGDVQDDRDRPVEWDEGREQGVHRVVLDGPVDYSGETAESPRPADDDGERDAKCGTQVLHGSLPATISPDRPPPGRIPATPATFGE